jgi:hypothetical protein
MDATVLLFKKLIEWVYAMALALRFVELLPVSSYRPFIDESNRLYSFSTAVTAFWQSRLVEHVPCCCPVQPKTIQCGSDQVSLLPAE